jgi:hypothetical protein
MKSQSCHYVTQTAKNIQFVIAAGLSISIPQRKFCCGQEPLLDSIPRQAVVQEQNLQTGDPPIGTKPTF